jgi:hypothetical protein
LDERDYSNFISTRGRGHRLLTLFGGRATEYSGTGQGVYGGISMNILPSLSTMSSSSTSLPGVLDVSSSLVYWLSHLIFRRKPNASHMCARIKFTHI